MKILFTSNRFHPDIGGIETISAVLARSFVLAGHSVRLVTQTSGDLHEDRQLFPFQVLRRPSAFHLLACYRWSDLVFQNNIEVRQLWPTLFFRRPLVISLHTWICSVGGHRSHLDRLKQLVLRLASKVVACSEAIRSDSIPSAVVIHNSYRRSLFRCLPQEPRRSALVFLGRLVSDKGVDLLLRSYAQLDRADWPLSIIGTGPESERLKALAGELGISEDVSFLGPLQGEALVRALNQHELMVVPSQWREPFGVVALEGLACGCVLLASDGGGLPDAVGSAGLLFRRGDQADLANKLRELITNDDLRARLRSEAAGHLASFKEDVMCGQYLELLERAIRHSRFR